MSLQNLEDSNLKKSAEEIPSDAAGLSSEAPTAESIQLWLVSKVSELLGVDADDVDVREPFASFGLDSIAAAGMSGDLEDWLGRRLPPTLLWDYPTIESLAEHLASTSS